MAVSKRLRYEILRRDNHTCRYCGSSAPDVKLTVDHVTPIALGGNDETTNLVTACAACNSGKTSSSPDAPVVDDVALDALRWARAREQASRIIGARHDAAMEYIEQVDDAWTEWRHVDGTLVERPSDWATSVRRFFENGLPVYVACDLVREAMTFNRARDTWRYYCGCCWRKVDEILEATQAIASAEAEDA